MEISITQSESEPVERINLTGELTIEAVHTVMNKLTPHCETMSSFAMDLTNVVELDTAGMQLLIYLQQIRNKKIGGTETPIIFKANDTVRHFLAFHHMDTLLCQEASA